MQVTTTPILGLTVITPEIHQDHRGYLMESYHLKQLIDAGIHIDFIQENESFSVKNTIRGLHYQLPPYTQTKLIRVLSGTIWDVAVDLRTNSPTFGQWEGIFLSAANKKQLVVPKGYAHGFSVLSHKATVLYKCDQYYAPTSEAGIFCLDQSLSIDWKIKSSPILSLKDRQLPHFKAAILPSISQNQLAQ